MNIPPFILGFTAALSAMAPQSAAAAEPDTVALAIVYDTSGSMRDPVRLRDGGMASKHVIAERAIGEVVARLQMYAANPSHHLSLGVYTFSHNHAFVLSRFGPFDATAAAALAHHMPQPGGGTPLGEAVLAAGNDVLRAKATHRHVLVITDGMNTVGPDPTHVLPQIAARATDHSTGVAFHFIAFDVAASRFSALKKLGATVVGAADEAQLGEQLTLILEKKILLEEEEVPAPKHTTN